MTKNGFNIQAIVKEAVDKFSPVQDDVVNNTSTLDAAALEAREKFEAEFDEEFKDPANHETLRSMDRRMDEVHDH